MAAAKACLWGMSWWPTRQACPQPWPKLEAPKLESMNVWGSSQPMVHISPQQDYSKSNATKLLCVQLVQGQLGFSFNQIFLKVGIGLWHQLQQSILWHQYWQILVIGFEPPQFFMVHLGFFLFTNQWLVHKVCLVLIQLGELPNLIVWEFHLLGLVGVMAPNIELVGLHGQFEWVSSILKQPSATPILSTYS